MNGYFLTQISLHVFKRLLVFYLGSVGAALTLGLRSGGVLTSLLVLPLYIPVLIFGAGAAGAVAVAVSPAAYLLITGALSLFALAIAPWASAAALRIALE